MKKMFLLFLTAVLLLPLAACSSEGDKKGEDKPLIERTDQGPAKNDDPFVDS